MTDQRIGVEIAGYRIESVLGRGRMGTAWTGAPRGSGRPRDHLQDRCRQTRGVGDDPGGAVSDRSRRRSRDREDRDHGSTGLAVGDGIVWVVDDLTGTLTAFEESDGSVRDSVALPGSLDGVVAGGGSVWVLDREAGVVSVVDPDTLTVLDTVRVGGDERDMVFGADAVWLADGADRTVTHMDPVDRRRRRSTSPGRQRS